MNRFLYVFFISLLFMQLAEAAYEQVQKAEGFTLSLRRDSEALSGARTEYTLQILDARGKPVENAQVGALAYHRLGEERLLCTIGGKNTASAAPLGSGAYRVSVIYTAPVEVLLLVHASVDGKSFSTEFTDFASLPSAMDARIISKGEENRYGIVLAIALAIAVLAAVLKTRR